jgi:quercetin dioxygenase-like cupin family protein
MSFETTTAMKEGLSAGLSTGFQTKVVLRQSDAEGGFSLLTFWAKPGFPLPRHSHSVDCLYYVLSGSVLMGSQMLRTGDGFFVPAHAPYQYSAGADGAEVLEIRHGFERFDTKIFDPRPEVMKAQTNLARTRREVWESMEISPTMAAQSAPYDGVSTK